MAAGSSEAASASREFSQGDLGDLCDALHKVSTKYRFFGLQIGLKMHEIHEIAEKYRDPADRLLEILFARLNQESALTCADIVKALKSTIVSEHSLATEFQKKFESKGLKEPSKKNGVEKVSQSQAPLRLSEKESERGIVASESKSDESENNKKAVKSAEVERQVHERDEPKSERAEKRACENEKCVSSEHSEPDEFKRDEMKGSEKKKVRFSEMAASPQSSAESDRKRKKSVKESETKTMDTDSESEFSDTYTKKETCSESDKYKNPQIYTEKVKIQPKRSIIKVHQKAATASDKLDSDDDDSQPWQPKRLKTMEMEHETESCSKNTSYERESEIPKSKNLKQFSHEHYSAPQSIASRVHKPHSQVKGRERVKESDSGMKAKRLVAHSSEQASDESETDCENEESDSGDDSSEDGEDSEGKSSDEEEKRETDEESSTPPSEEEVKKTKEKSVSHEKEKTKKEGFEQRKLRVSKAAVEQSKYDSLQGGRRFDETHTRKVKRNREGEAASLKYDSRGDDEQSDPGHGSRDQEEHDIQQTRRKKKKQRRESSMSHTAIGSSSPSTSQEEKKKQPVSKKQGHKKKHVRKMKEKRERMKRGKEKAGRSSGTDDSSPECDMTKNQYEGEMKELVNIFERFFGQLCHTVFDPVDIAVELQKKGLISKAVVRDMMLSQESQQSKIIHFIDGLHEIIRSCSDRLFVVIEVMLENEALQQTAREILRETGTQCLVCVLHFVLDSKTLFPAGRVCPVETAAKFPSQVPPSDTAVPSTADTISPTTESM